MSKISLCVAVYLRISSNLQKTVNRVEIISERDERESNLKHKIFYYLLIFLIDFLPLLISTSILKMSTVEDSQPEIVTINNSEGEIKLDEVYPNANENIEPIQVLTSLATDEIVRDNDITANRNYAPINQDEIELVSPIETFVVVTQHEVDSTSIEAGGTDRATMGNQQSAEPSDTVQNETLLFDIIIRQPVSRCSNVFGIRWNSYIVSHPMLLRSLYIIYGLLEVLDIVTDFIVVLQLYKLAKNCDHQYHTDDHLSMVTDDDHIRSCSGREGKGELAFYWNLCVASTIFFILSCLMIFARLIQDWVSSWTLSTLSDGKPQGFPYAFRKLELFLLGPIRLLFCRLSNEDLIELHKQRVENQQNVTANENVLDAIVGIHEKNNFFDFPCPLGTWLILGCAYNPNNNHSYIPTAWEILCYPLHLLYFTNDLYQKCWCICAVPWLILGSILSPFTVFVITLLGLINLLFKSHHKFTIRLMEDIPQSTINFVFLLSSYNYDNGSGNSGNSQLARLTILSLIPALLLLSMTLMEMLIKSIVNTVPCDMLQRKIATCELSFFGVWYVIIVGQLLMPAWFVYYFVVFVLKEIGLILYSIVMEVVHTLCCGGRERIPPKQPAPVEIDTQV